MRVERTLNTFSTTHFYDYILKIVCIAFVLSLAGLQEDETLSIVYIQTL